MYLPTKEQFLIRDKSKLEETCKKFKINTPPSAIMTDLSQVDNLLEKLELPIMVKGRFYEAYKVNNSNEIQKHFNQLRAKWGLPIIIQEFFAGEEYNIAGIGNGKGEAICAIPIKKTVVTEKGKGFAAVVIQDPILDKFTKSILKSLKWRGPFELEVLKANKDNKYYLLEINPRVPAWIALSAGAGQNIPATLVELALGKNVKPMKKYKVGKIFIRHSEDIRLDIATIGELTSTNELHDLRTKPVLDRKSDLLNKKGA